MVNLANIVGQTADRFDYRRGQRQQMAEAFEAFKKSNPLATVADFQNFIDQHSGGNNYIAGGAPGKEVLQRIAASNAAREAERQKTLAFKRYQERRKIEKDLAPEIENYLIDLKKTNNQQGIPGYDYTKAVDDFLNMRPELKDLGINFNAIMTGEARDQAIANRVNENLGLGKNYFETLPIGTYGTLEAFQQVTNLPKAVAEQVYNNLKTAKEQEVTQKVNEEIEKYSEKFNKLINEKNSSNQYNTPAEAQAIIESQIKNSPYVDKLKEGDWLDKIYNAGKERYDQRVDEDMANDLTKLGELIDRETIMEIITNVIRSQGKDVAKEKILKDFGYMISGEGWNNATGKAKLDKFLDNRIATMVGINQDTLDGLEWQRKKDVNEQRKVSITELKTQNADKASKIFSGGEGKVLAGNIATLPTIVNHISSRWFMDERTTSLILEFAQGAEGLGEDVLNNVGQMKNALEAFLQDNGGTPLSQMQSQIEEMSGLRPLSRTTFGDYKKDLETHIQSSQDSLIEQAQTVVDGVANATTKEEVQSAIRVLNNLKTQYKSWTEGLGKTIERNYDDRRAWRDIDGKQYDQNVINNLFSGVEDFDLSDIDAKIEELTNTAETLQPANNSANDRALTDNRTQKEKEQDALEAKLTFNRNRPEFEGIPVDAMDWNIFGGSPWKDLTDRQVIIQKGIEEFFVSDRPREIWQELGLNAKIDGVEFNYQDFVDTPIEWILTNEKAKEIAKQIWGEDRYKRIEEAVLADQ
tara:strand:+ start:616 stop:2874 length:2259 start_codon:yes stop_codon:yes gene_type:complete